MSTEKKATEAAREVWTDDRRRWSLPIEPPQEKEASRG